MKKAYITFLLLFVSLCNTHAQISEVELVVNATGDTKEQAIDNALRIAIEQTFGAFVSSNTTLLDDDLVKDEIVTVSTGTIKNYNELSTIELSPNNVSVSLKVLVSVTKLTEFAESHGSSCELKGANLGANARLQRLYEENERIAIQNLFTQVSKVDNLVDIDIKVESATVYGVNIKLTFKATKNLEAVNEMIFNTLASLGLTDEEIEARKALGLYSQRNVFYCSGENTWSKPTEIIVYTRHNYGNENKLQRDLRSLIEKRIDGFMLSCNFSAPVNFQINDVESDFLNSTFNYYQGYPTYNSHHGHPTISFKGDANTIWSLPKKGRKAPLFLSSKTNNDNDKVIDKTVACKYSDITGKIIGEISWVYEINEQILSKLERFYIEPIPLQIETSTETNTPSVDPDKPMRMQLPKKTN